MELKDFVTATLTQIVEGVFAAQAVAHQHDARVGSMTSGISTAASSASLGMIFSEGSYVQIVEFDVALTVTDGTGTRGGIGVLGGFVNLGSAGESKAETTAASRVKFTVPVRLPTQ